MSNPESHDKTASGPVTATIMKENPPSRVARRTRGQSRGPITRLMSPSDFGRLLKPFVFLDRFETQGNPFTGFGLHPHSGIATFTYVAEGSISYQDTNGATGLLPAGGIEWMRAGGGVWHGGGTGESGRTAGLPALDRLASRTRTGNIGERLSVTGGDSPRRVGACPPRQLRKRDQCDQCPVADELSRRAFES